MPMHLRDPGKLMHYKRHRVHVRSAAHSAEAPCARETSAAMRYSDAPVAYMHSERLKTAPHARTRKALNQSRGGPRWARAGGCRHCQAKTAAILIMLFYLFLSVRHTGKCSTKKIAGYIKLTSGPCAYSISDL